MQETLTFKLEDFEGPLDLLLYLVGKNKMNLYDVNIMELIDQYTAAIHTLQEDRMEVSSEFIDMAAHLVQMKSALLPILMDRKQRHALPERIWRQGWKCWKASWKVWRKIRHWQWKKA